MNPFCDICGGITIFGQVRGVKLAGVPMIVHAAPLPDSDDPNPGSGCVAAVNKAAETGDWEDLPAGPIRRQYEIVGTFVHTEPAAGQPAEATP